MSEEVETSNSDKHNKKSNEKSNHYPPKLSGLDKLLLLFFWPGLLFSVFYIGDQLCFRNFFTSSICRTYIAFGFILAAIMIDRIIRHKLLKHNARLEDESKVRAIFVEAETVEPRFSDPSKPDNFEKKKKELKDEVARLKEFGRKGWTEYEVLSLNQLLVDFLKVEELKARALSSLEDLQEYSTDDRHDEEHYNSWKGRIEEATKIIDAKKNLLDKDGKAEKLRSELRTLLEHVADYDQYWAEGSMIVRGLMTCGVMSIPILLAMGMLPLLHSSQCYGLSIFNWGFLGISGAVTAVLLNIRKSNLVEVGNTKGKRELWKAILGSALGLVAGILLYSMIAGEILSGSAFPEIGINQPKEIGRSIFWAIASGFSFEWVFDHIRTSIGSNNE